MSTNSDSTSNNAGTGNKKLRGAITVLQNDIDMADAVLQNGGTALQQMISFKLLLYLQTL